MKVTVQNMRDKTITLRPYKNRAESVVLQGGQTAEIELNHCRWDVAKFAKKWFEAYHCRLLRDAPKTVEVKKEEVKVEPVVVTPPAPVVEEKKEEVKVEEVKIEEKIEEKKEETIVPEVKVEEKKEEPKEEVKLRSFKVTDGDFKHYNPSEKSWQKVRVLKDQLINKVICEMRSKEHYLVKSITNNRMDCQPITREEADKLIGFGK